MHEDLIALLRRARTVLDRYMFDESSGAICDDVAELCMAIDDALPEDGRVHVRRAALERSAA